MYCTTNITLYIQNFDSGNDIHKEYINSLSIFRRNEINVQMARAKA